MTTEEFLAQLERHRDHRLAFRAGAATVSPGYHVTEIKAVTIDAVDCGGRSTSWKETTFQLWSPSAEPAGELMSVTKFLGIYHRVGSMVPIERDARVRAEYGPPGEIAVSYVVTDVVAQDDGVLEVRLAAPAVACKGHDRTFGDIPLVDASAPPIGRLAEDVGQVEVGCCSPAAPVARAACCA
ncbi:hypothetical protein BH23DEI1_BH23DEI1_12830 [soil metagenome]